MLQLDELGLARLYPFHHPIEPFIPLLGARRVVLDLVMLVRIVVLGPVLVVFSRRRLVEATWWREHVLLVVIVVLSDVALQVTLDRQVKLAAILTQHTRGIQCVLARRAVDGQHHIICLQSASRGEASLVDEADPDAIVRLVGEEGETKLAVDVGLENPHRGGDHALGGHLRRVARLAHFRAFSVRHLFVGVGCLPSQKVVVSLSDFSSLQYEEMRI